MKGEPIGSRAVPSVPAGWRMTWWMPRPKREPPAKKSTRSILRRPPCIWPALGRRLWCINSWWIASAPTGKGPLHHLGDRVHVLGRVKQERRAEREDGFSREGL